MERLYHILEFEWDSGNLDKSFKKHGVSPKESEEVFLDENVRIAKSIKSPLQEERHIAIGKTGSAKILFIVFTIREEKIRVISARMANKKEREVYEQKIKKNTSL